MYNKIFLVGKPSFYILRPWIFFKDTYREIKGFLQRGQRGWADEDTWTLDEYLARVISETTKHLAEHTNGFPGELNEEKWKEILLNISNNVIGVEKADGMNIKYDDYKELEKRQKEALILFVQYFNDLWD